MTTEKTATINGLHNKARLAIESGESKFRDAAELLAQAEELGATQRQSGAAIGKSASWVNGLLKWRRLGYKTDVPFPRKARPLFGPGGRVQAAEQRKWRSMTAEEAEAQTARAQAERAKAEAQKAKAEAEISKARVRAEKARARDREQHGRFGGHRERKKIDSGPRDHLIRALGMLGSDDARERASAALVVEKQRVELGLMWDDLIVEAEIELDRAA
jgi:hypothetical protein